MDFLNPFTSLTSFLKLLLVIACVALGAYGTYKSTHFVSDYYKYKAAAATETAVAKEQSTQATNQVASSKVDDAAETAVLNTDSTLLNAHEAQKQDVRNRVNAITHNGGVTKPAGNKPVIGTPSTDTPTATTGPSVEVQVSTIYINTLWSNYCEATGDTDTQCKAAG